MTAEARISPASAIALIRGDVDLQAEEVVVLGNGLSGVYADSDRQRLV